MWSRWERNSYGALVEWYWQGKRSAGRKTCRSATSSTTNLTWTDQGSKPGLRGDRPGDLTWPGCLVCLVNEDVMVMSSKQVVNVNWEWADCILWEDEWGYGFTEEAVGHGSDGPGFDFWHRKEVLSFPKLSDRLWGPPSLLLNEYWGGGFPWYGGWGVKLTSHFRLLPILTLWRLTTLIGVVPHR